MANLISENVGNNIMELQLSILVFQEGNFFIAYCPSLNLSSYGDSVNDAKLGFDETIEAFLEDTTTKGTLLQDLKDHGWIFTRNKISQPAQVDFEEVPAGMLRKQFNQVWIVPAQC